jgi:hypothetical protein
MLLLDLLNEEVVEPKQAKPLPSGFFSKVRKEINESEMILHEQILLQNRIALERLRLRGVRHA